MRNLIIFVILFFFLVGCKSEKSIKGNYYNKCYSCHLPMLALIIDDSTYTLFSGCVKGEKGIGKWSYSKGILFLNERKLITNNFTDTLIVNDSTKYYVKDRKIIPFNYKKCYFIKTKNKNKLIQIESEG